MKGIMMGNNDVAPGNGGARRRGGGKSLAKAVAVSAVAALLLSGCGFVNSQPSSTGATKSLKMTLSTEQNTGLKKLLPAFEKESGIKVDKSFAETADLNQQLRVQLTSGTAPDIFRVSPGSSSPVAANLLGSAGSLLELNGSWTSKVPASTQTLSKYKGKLVAFPLSQNAIVMAYNKKVFTDANIEVPTTWSEFMDACAQLKSAGIVPVSAGFTGGIYLQFLVYQLAASIVYADNPKIDEKMASGDVTFATSPEWKEVFQKLLDLQTKGYLTAGANGVSGEQSLRDVASGKAAMVGFVSAGLPQLNGYAAGGAADIGVFALPGTDNPAQTRIPVAPDFIGVNAKTKNADNAKKFLEFLAKPENVKAYANALETLPGLTTPGAEGPAQLKSVMPMLNKGKTAGFANYLWPNGDTQQTLLQSGQQLIAGEISVADLLKQLDVQYAKGS